jgi:hypothetical protein
VHPAAPGQDILASATVIDRIKDGFAKETDSLVYDQGSVLTGVIQFYDDSDRYLGEDYDTFYYLFSKNGDPSSPPGINARSYTDLNQIDHLLYYDGEGRIVRDTNTEGYINKYGYGTDFIASSTYNPPFIGNGPGENYMMDTFYLEAGNIIQRSEALYNPPSPSGQPGVTLTYMSYSNYPNPFYIPSVSKDLGILLNSFFFQNLMTDFVSPNSRTQWNVEMGHPVNFSWTLDSAGRVSSGSGAYDQGALTYSFRYKN